MAVDKKGGLSLRRVVSIFCSLILVSGFCACKHENALQKQTEIQTTTETTAAVSKEASFSVDKETHLPEQTGKDPSSRTAEITESPTQAPTYARELSAVYVGPQRYETEQVEYEDFRVSVKQGDRVLAEDPQGWSVDITPLLKAGDNTFTVSYDGLTCEAVVWATEGLRDGNSACKDNVASSKKISGDAILKEALCYLSVAYEPERTEHMPETVRSAPKLTRSQRSALFVRELYEKQGIRLPYTMEQLERSGVQIDKEAVKAGDLVAFSDMGASDKEERLLGIYVGGDFLLSLNEAHKADFYWMHETECRRLFENTCDLYGEECFAYVMDAFSAQGIYGEWITSYVDEFPYMIGRVNKFFFTVDLSSRADGYYPTYFCYDAFLLPEAFVEHWKQDYLEKNALCEIMKNGEYIRFDAAGDYHFKVDCDRKTWKSLTPGVYGEYWNMDWSYLME